MSEPSRHEIWKMFDRISPTYDQINRIVSFGKDRSWRKEVVKHFPQRASLKILDLATGTGDQAIACLENHPQIESIIGIDLAADMIKIAKEKCKKKGYDQKIDFVIADAEHPPFGKEQFDAATFSFGIRNVNNPLSSLKQIFQLLKPQGRCLILEFSLPPKAIRPFYLFYLRHILPRIGGLFSKDVHAYRYLNQTIETFPSGQAFCSLMAQAGFSPIRSHRLALGAVTLYVGDKQ